MKKWKIAAIATIVLCVLSCVIIFKIALREEIPTEGNLPDFIGNNEEVSEQIEEASEMETEIPKEDPRLAYLGGVDADIAKQLICILDNKDMWYKGYQGNLYEEKEDLGRDIWHYMICDLNQDGTLEMVVSIVEGEMQYSTSFYYEVNEMCTGLEPIGHIVDQIYDSEPDIIEPATDVYFDEQNDIYYYIEEDVMRYGATNSYVAKGAISLEEEGLRYQIFMYAKDAPNYMGTYTIYEDAYGNRIRESKYSDASRYFKDCTNLHASFGWFVIDYELIGMEDKKTDEEIFAKDKFEQKLLEQDILLLQQLLESYRGFCVE